jgi:ketosteroid isomerase-like protein
MKIIFRPVIVIALVGLSIWLWSIFFPSPEKIIRKRLDELAATATFSAKDTVVVRAAKAQKLISFLSEDAQLVFDSPAYGQRSLSGRDEITEAVNAGLASTRSLSVEFLDVNVTVGTDGQTAEADLTVKARAAENKDFDVQEMHFILKKIDGTWLITRAETVKTLS